MQHPRYQYGLHVIPQGRPNFMCCLPVLAQTRRVKTAATLRARGICLYSRHVPGSSPNNAIHNMNISELGLETSTLSVWPPVFFCCVKPMMLDSNAIIAVVTLLITCVPGGWFAIRVLRPRCMAWKARRGRPTGALQPLPLHHPLPFTLEPPVLHSSSHFIRTSTMRMSATYSFVCMISRSI